jgi:hypothetical protein
MPSLHLDIPSIDWIGRAPRADRPGRGKARPTEEAPPRAPADGLANRAPGQDARDPLPWPHGPAGAVA